MSAPRRALYALLVLCLAVAAVALVRAWLLTSPVGVVEASPRPVTLALDEAALAERLARAVRIPTVSSARDDGAEIDRLVALLRTLYPRTFARAAAHGNVERISDRVPDAAPDGASLLLTLAGTESGLKPIVLLSHLDVVPIAPGSEGAWAAAPFSGNVQDGYVYGRGTLDDKSGVLGILEAMEALLTAGATPRRTVILAFGHDEEIGGEHGAAAMASVLAERGVEAELVLDEGGVIGRGLLDGIDRPTAMIGIAEKGYESIELVARSPGGHASMPPPLTAVGRLARAVESIETTPMRPRFGGPLAAMLTTLAPERGFVARLATANLWLFGPLIGRALSKTDSGRAMMMTTFATTVFYSGEKDNVLPQEAHAVVNVRILPGDSADSVLKHVREAVRDDQVELGPRATPHEPSAVAPVDSDAFRHVASAVATVFPETLVVPFLTVGATDAAHYQAKGISKNVLRFLPVAFEPTDLARFHGTDERIGVHAYADAVRFYAQLLSDYGFVPEGAP